MRFIKFIKKILGLELNHLLEDEQYENIEIIAKNKKIEQYYKKENWEETIKQFQTLNRAMCEAGVTISDFQRLYYKIK